MHLSLPNSRLLAITLPTEVENVFLTHCEAEEKLSSSFDIHMTLLSTDAAIDPNSLIGKSVTVEINTSINAESRYFNGIVQSFVIGAMEEGLYTYTAKASSWLSFLDLAVDCRIFQNKTVPEIVTGILQEYGYNDFDTSRLHNKYKPLDYCTQYCESTFNFINRLLAEAGIFYFFKHTKDKHILTLGDTSIAMPKCYEKEIQFHPQGNLRDQYLFAWHRNYKSYAGKTAHIDYDFENPYVTLVGKQGKQAKSKFAQTFEVYHPNFHKSTDEANAKANLQFEAYEAEHNLVEGGGTYSSFICGGCFKFPESNREADCSEYFLTRVSHIATDNSFVMNDTEETLSQGYQNFFTCIPKITPYRTYPYKFDKPHISGPQPALVVGPKGEEIYTDKYGRVKIHFYWSRQGNKNEQSSCWVRVAQLWAGQGYGMFFIPRIGQEVIVNFYNGDPDKPIIIGSVYNGEHLPPYELPANKTQSGIKTRSSKGGAAKDANELRFEDQKDNEEIYLHAQRDYRREIEHCENAIIINGDHKMEVKSGKSVLEASESIEFKVGDNSILLTKDKIILQGKAIFLNDV